MKKQLITKQDIQRDLLVKINKAKKFSLFLTTLTAAAILSYILFIINYADLLAEYTHRHLAGRGLHPAFGLFGMPAVILFFILFLLDFYYIDLFRAKKELFTITEEKLCQKKSEQISYYRRIQEENSLYFQCKRVSVENEVYSQANVGDRFYVILLRANKAPRLVYPAKYYKIENFSQ